VVARGPHSGPSGYTSLSGRLSPSQDVGAGREPTVPTELRIAQVATLAIAAAAGQHEVTEGIGAAVGSRYDVIRGGGLPFLGLGVDRQSGIAVVAPPPAIPLGQRRKTLQARPAVGHQVARPSHMGQVSAFGFSA
jgi:hypothetical protein